MSMLLHIEKELIGINNVTIELFYFSVIHAFKYQAETIIISSKLFTFASLNMSST